MLKLFRISNIKIFLILPWVLVAQLIYGQDKNIIKCKITVKEKYSENHFLLMKGWVTYNKSIDKTEIDFDFPEKVKILLFRDSLLQYKNDTLISKEGSPFLNNFILFKLIVGGALKSYGLNRTIYKAVATEESKDGQIITTWKTSGKTSIPLGKIVLSQKDNRLFGVAIFDKDDKLVSRSIFYNYILVSGYDFPTKIIQISTTEKGEFYKITEFKNIEVQ